MNSNFEYYKVFYYVAKYENLTKASSVLKTSQPAVTRTIHNLENELGVNLFVRTLNGTELTAAGKIYLEYAKEIKLLKETMNTGGKNLLQLCIGRVRPVF